MDQRYLDLYDEYTHRPLPRRVFMARLVALAGSTAAATTALPLLENNYALAQVVPEGDGRIEAGQVTFAGPAGEMRGYLARSKGLAGKAGAAIVIHENRGLNPHIRDITRRLAVDGFVALGVDLLSRQGGTPEDQDKAREMIGKTDPAGIVADLLATSAYLKSRPDVNGKVASIGFCWGGGVSAQLAVNDPHLNGAIVYYGVAPAPDQVPRIKARLLLHYAEHDNWVNPGLSAFETALQGAGVRYARFDYPGAQHAFNNDTAGPRYNEAAATLSWQRTVAFLKEVLAA